MTQPMKLSFTQDVSETSPCKREIIGAFRITADGRKFRYAKARGELTAGTMGFTPEHIQEHKKRPCSSANRGDRVISLAVGEVGVAENYYGDGFIQVSNNGKGWLYRILANTDCPSCGTVILTLASALLTGLDASYTAALIPSPWAGVAPPGDRSPTMCAGVSPCDVPSGHYYFAQTGGATCVRAYEEYPHSFPGGLPVVDGKSMTIAFHGDVIVPCFLAID
jgi:hypothetical protein